MSPLQLLGDTRSLERCARSRRKCPVWSKVCSWSFQEKLNLATWCQVLVFRRNPTFWHRIQKRFGALGLASKGCSSGALMHRPCPRVHRSSSCPLMHQAPVPPSLESATCITFRNCTLLKHRLVLLLETVPCISFANSVCQTASFATFRNCILQYILYCTQ